MRLLVFKKGKCFIKDQGMRTYRRMEPIAMLNGIVISCVYDVHIVLNGIKIQVQPRGCRTTNLGDDTWNKIFGK